MKSILFYSMVLIGLIGCGGGGGGSGGSSGGGSGGTSATPNPYPAPNILDADKQEYLRVINNARAVEQDCGTEGIKPAVPALSWNDELYSAAYEHSNDLAESNTASHDGSGTASDWTGMDLGGKQSTYIERIENNGYSWRSAGENITMGTTRDTAQKAIDSWLASDGHCANLMSSSYTEVGLAHVEKAGTTYIHYWTQEFGKPR